MSLAIRDLAQAVAGIRAFLVSPYGPQPPGVFCPSSATTATAYIPGPRTDDPRGADHPDPVPLIAITAPGLARRTGLPTVLQPPAPSAAFPFGGFASYAAPHAGVDEHLFQVRPLMPTYSAPASSPLRREGAYNVAPSGQQPPRFTKLEFATYDGTVDPLNWLNQCDQFFREQRSLVSDRTWIASYHLRGAAQMWYYALE
jgi:hypothetical protein